MAGQETFGAPSAGICCLHPRALYSGCRLFPLWLYLRRYLALGTEQPAERLLMAEVGCWEEGAGHPRLQPREDGEIGSVPADVAALINSRYY